VVATIIAIACHSRLLTVETLGDVRTLNQFDDALRRPGQFKTSAGERRGAVAN
jgi:hypothetical protein